MPKDLIKDYFRWKEISENFHLDQRKYLWYSAKYRAKDSGIEFSILPNDIQIPKFCPYLGVPLTYTKGSGRVWTNASIDRIDNRQGYTKHNIQVISDRANRMKNDASIVELIVFAENVLSLHKN